MWSCTDYFGTRYILRCYATADMWYRQGSHDDCATPLCFLAQLLFQFYSGLGTHSGYLLAVGLSEVAPGVCLFVGDPLMGPAIGAVLTLSAGDAKRCWGPPASRQASQPGSQVWP